MAMMMLRVVAIAALFVNMAMAANYDIEWELNSSFQAWANNITFMTGDTITFVYGSTQSVLEVAKTDFDSCQTNASISSDSSGKTVISLNSIGNRYFISGTPTYCDRGMKVVITTVAAPAPPPGSTTPSAPPATTPTPSSPAPGSTSSPPAAASPVPSPVKTPPSKSPSISPSTAPSKSPKPSPPLPAGESPASPPDSQPSAGHKVNGPTGFATGLGFIIMMLLAL